jgi:hypothetical protein
MRLPASRAFVATIVSAALRRGSAQTSRAGLPRLVLEARRVSSLLAHGLHGRRRAGPGESFWQ